MFAIRTRFLPCSTYIAICVREICMGKKGKVPISVGYIDGEREGGKKWGVKKEKVYINKFYKTFLVVLCELHSKKRVKHIVRFLWDCWIRFSLFWLLTDPFCSFSESGDREKRERERSSAKKTFSPRSFSLQITQALFCWSIFELSFSLFGRTRVFCISKFCAILE